MPQYEISVPGQGTFRVDSPTELTDQQAWQAVQNQLNAPQPTTGAFAAGVKSYLPQVQETFGGLKTLLGVGAERVLGEGQISRGLIESGAASMKEAEAKRQPFMTAERGSFTDALDKGVGAVLTEWLPYQAGSGAAQLLEALALVGAGGVVGTMTAPGPGTLAGAGTGLVARELAKRGVKEAAEKILKERGEDAAKVYFEKAAKDVALDIGKKRGQTAALAGQAAFYGTGQTTSRAVEEAEKLGGTATDIELARVLPAAAVSTVAEFIGDKIALGALKGIKPGEASKYAPVDLAKNILLNIGLTGTKEVPVEVIQSVAERYGAKLSLTDAQALKEYIDATAASYGMAVAPGVGGGVRQTMAERAKPVTPEAQPVTPETTTSAAQLPVAEVPPVAPPVAPAPEVASTAPETPVTPVAETPVTPTVETPVVEAPPTILSTPAAPVAETPAPPAPLPVTAEPAAPKFEPQIVSRQPAPDGMEVHVFTTTDGYGTGLFDADANQYVNGSVTRFAGEDTLPKAEARAAEMLQKATPKEEEPRTPTLIQQTEAFGKAIGAVRPHQGALAGRINLPAQKAAKEGNFQGVLSALEKSKNVIVAEIAKRAKSLGTKIVIDDSAKETYTGPSAFMRQMSIDGAKMHLDALNKIRALAPQVDALPDKAELSYAIRGETINAIDGGESAGRMGLEDIARMGHSMFAPLSIGESKLRTKEDFKRLQKAYEDLTSEYGENELQLTSTGSAEMRGVAGVYDADTDTIRVPEYAAKREEVLSHEIVHAQTVQSIANPTLRQKPIVARLNKLYEHVKKELEGRPGRAPYGIQSIQEFVAEGMGNPAFQFLLKKIKYENTSAWDSFVQTIANLIGVKRDTAFTELLSIYSDLTTEQKAPAAPTVEAAAPKAEEPPAVEPVTTPQTLQEFQERISTDRKRSDVRKANLEGNFSGLVAALQQSTNPAIQRIGELASSLVNKVKLIPSAPLGGRTMGVYIPSEETIQLRPKNAGDEETSAHEVLHALIAKAQKNPTEAQKPVVNEIRKLYQYVKVELKRQGKSHYGLKNEREFTAEAMTNPEFQYELMKIPYKGDMNAWSQFVKLIAKLLGIKESNALTEVMSLSEKLAQIDAEAKPAQKKYVDETEAVALDRKTLIDAVSAWRNKTGINMYSLVNAVIKRADRQASGVGVQFNKDRSISDKPWITWIKKASDQQIADLVKEINATDEKLILVEAKTEPEEVESREEGTPGEQAISIVNSLGMGVKPPEPGFFKRTWNAINGAGENPSLSKEELKKTLTKFTDKIETSVFSTDAAFNNDLTRSVIKDINQQPEVLAMLLQASQSQTVNIDNVTSRALMIGSARHNKDMQKWEAIGTDEDGKKLTNFKDLGAKLEEISKKYNISVEEAEQIGHTYLIAKRLPGIIRRNAELDAKIAAEKATAKPDRKQIEEWDALKVYVSPKQEAMIEPGLSLVKMMPELSDIVDIQQGIRKNIVKPAVESGLWSQEYADAMLDNVDWVPFYRDEQLDAGGGPLQVIKGLQVKSKEFRLKGSDAAVANVFDNQFLWAQYLLSRAMRAQKARAMVDLAAKTKINGEPMAVKVTEEKRGMNIVRVFRDGKQELWDMKDPMYVDAFMGIQNVANSMFPWAAKLAEILRNSVILYPLFSVAQVPQDAYAAMFTSGLKPQYALRIPFLAVKEFIKTLNKTSATHKALINFGVVGARTFNADAMRNDAEIYAGVRPPKGGWAKFKDNLEHISMAGDNAVRQAVYEAAQQQGVSKPEAIEKAFEIFNVRRRGTNKLINLAGSTIPFFYAYLAAQRVAYRTITGAGTSPTQRKAALETLAYTSASVFALSMLYAMMVADDEDYQETPTAVRDRTLTIPGSGGVRIPLRPDFFLFPKIIAEHTYLMITDQGYQDGAKFRKAMLDGLANAVSSPTPLPQIVKPSLEVAINYSFFDSKPIVGTFEKQKETARQFNDSTSEFAKLIGSTGVMAPLNIDYLVRGYFGSFGGLALFMTNFLNSDPDVPRPELSWKEAAAALPGTSGFLKRPQESALKNDFYQLRDEVEKAANTFSDIKNRSPEGIQAFLEDEKNMARLGLAKGVDKINRELSKIRKVMTQITNMPESQMSADEKSENIRQLRELEREILRSVNVKELREMAKI